MTQQHSHVHHGGRGHHDWHSAGYVHDWIEGDVTKDDTRRPLLRRLLDLAPYRPDAAINVLDVGGGYGIVSGVVLERFPNATVTLQDYSDPMLEQARQRLSAFGSRVRFEKRDFTQPGWTDGLGGPFDLAVSGIAIHNLGKDGPIAQVYRAVCEALKPGGTFLDLDFAGFTGGIQTHLRWLRQAGFSRAHEAWVEQSQSGMAAFKD